MIQRNYGTLQCQAVNRFTVHAENTNEVVFSAGVVWRLNGSSVPASNSGNDSAHYKLVSETIISCRKYIILQLCIRCNHSDVIKGITAYRILYGIWDTGWLMNEQKVQTL